MRIPRITLGQMMLATGLLALDFGAVVSLFRSQVWPEFWVATVCGLPMFNLLILVGYAVLRNRKIDGLSREFLVGFVVSSFVLLACAVRLSIFFPEAGRGFPRDFSAIFLIGLMMAYFAIPQVLLAAIGGGIYARFRSRLAAVERHEG